MSKLKAPPDKKKASYDRDHRVAMDAPHAFRKGWPKKKAHVNRIRRRAADRAVEAVLKGADPSAILVPKRVRGEHLQKFGVGRLGEFVANREERRRNEFFPTYVGTKYVSKEHREAFRAFLAVLVRGRSALARQRASLLASLLDTSLPTYSSQRSKQRWLRSFFAEEIQWESRVRDWMGRF